MLPSMMRRQALIAKRYPTILDHGTAVRDYTATPTAIPFYGSVQPMQGETDVINRNGAEVAYTILSGLEQVIKHDDLVEYAGENYFVNGAPERWETGILDHQVIRLSRWAG